jgi:hypothetical protein
MDFPNHKPLNRRYPDGKTTKKISRKRSNGKGFKTNGADARIVNASTIYETCTEHLNPFGEL